jgi:hypothetical protein
MHVLHFAILVSLFFIGLKQLRHDVMAAIPALFLLVWSDLIFSGLLLSSVGQLGNRFAYFTTSIAVAIFLTVLLRRLRMNSGNQVLDTVSVEDQLSNRWARRASWLAIFYVVIATIMICVFYVANNPDSVTYRFPRAFFYIDQGSLSQIPGDFRIQFYPFNMSLVYVWFVTYGLPLVWLNLFGVVTWLVGGVAVWRFARDIGAGHTAALMAAAIFITSPAVLVSASSTNDDMIAGVPLLIGAMFLMRWWKSGSWLEVMMAALGLGLSLGSKWHWVMMVPIATLLFVYVVYQLIRQEKLILFLHSRAKQIFVAGCVMLILTLPVFIINLSQSGKLLPEIPELMNSPFSIETASVHSIVSTASMLLGPIPDLYISLSKDARQAFGVNFNNWTNEHLLSWLKDSPHYVSDGYVFLGVGSSIADLGVGEVTAWLGFAPWLLGLVLLLLLRRSHNQFQSSALWLTLIFFGWHFTRDFMLKWVAGEGIYYAFSMAIAAPALAYLWDYKSEGGKLKENFLKGLCIAVLAANIISATNYFLFNYQRNLPSLLATQFSPNAKLISPHLGQVLKSSQRTMIVFNRWGLPYLTFINENPRARYATSLTLPTLPTQEYELALMMSDDIPVEFRNDDRSRLSLVGYYGMFWAPQYVWGAGPALDELRMQQGEEIVSVPKYALLKMGNSQMNPDGSLKTIIFPKLDGVGANEEFLLSANLVTPSLGVTTLFAGVPFSEKPTITIPSGQSEGYLIVKLERRDSSRIAGHVWLPLNPNQNWLKINPKQRWRDLNMNGFLSYNFDEPVGSYGFVSGWKAPNANFYRWMDSGKSKITFPSLKGFGQCTMGVGLISQGKEGDAHISLNGTSLGNIPLIQFAHAKDYQFALPDNAMDAENNHVVLTTQSKEKNFHSLGLKYFSIDCATFKGARVH